MTAYPLTISARFIEALIRGDKTKHVFLMPWQPYPAVTKSGQVDWRIQAGMVYDTDIVWPMGYGHSIVSNKPAPHPEWVAKHQRRKPGDTLWVRGNIRTKKKDALAWVIITEVKAVRLQDLTADDAEKIGAFAHLAHESWDKVFRDERSETAIRYLKEAWDRAHQKGYTWDWNPYVELLTFKVIS